MSLFNVTLILFLIMDPLGNINSYLSLVKELDPKRKRWIVLREMLIALVAMIGFNYLGEYIFSLLELSETTVRLSSCLILF
jgi:multiple antibiotic resistance protein